MQACKLHALAVAQVTGSTHQQEMKHVHSVQDEVQHGAVSCANTCITLACPAALPFAAVASSRHLLTQRCWGLQRLARAGRAVLVKGCWQG
jgi:hypothetical protein